jgi:hypothetical protein
MVNRAINKMITNSMRSDEQIRSIFRRIYELPGGGGTTARVIYETKRSILKKLAGRLAKHSLSR